MNLSSSASNCLETDLNLKVFLFRMDTIIQLHIVFLKSWEVFGAVEKPRMLAYFLCPKWLS